MQFKTIALMSSISLTSAAFGAFAGICAYDHLPKKPVEEVRTHRLIVVDALGNPRATLGASSEGDVSMEFKSVAQQPSFALGIFHEGNIPEPPAGIGLPRIRFFNESNSPSAEISMDAKGSSTMSFLGRNPIGGLTLGYLSDLSDSGTPRGGWGLRAYYRDTVRDVGVAAYETDYPYSIVPSPPSRSTKLRK